jgi:hypothetical protein
MPKMPVVAGYEPAYPGLRHDSAGQSPVVPAVNNPVRGSNVKEVGIMARNKRRHRRAGQINADKWERMQLLSAVMRLAEMVFDLWRDRLL